MRMNKTAKIFQLLALMVIMSAFFIPMTASAEEPETILIVESVWQTGGTVHITAVDPDNGDVMTFQVSLSDYSHSDGEYITIRVMDDYGRVTEPVIYRNPYYSHPEPVEAPPGLEGDIESFTGLNSFTPDGTGTVIDRATDGDGKEFYTIETPDENVFYLVIDRQRNSENVYFLNAVTERDLLSLAQPGDGTSAGTVIDDPEAILIPGQPEQNEPQEQPSAQDNGSTDTGMIVIVLVIVAAVGGAGYYFKIVRPKQNGNYDDEESEEDVDEDEEIDVPGDGYDEDDGDSENDNDDD